MPRHHTAHLRSPCGGTPQSHTSPYADEFPIRPFISLRGIQKQIFRSENMGLPNTPSGNNQPKPGGGSGQQQQTPIKKVLNEIPKRVDDALNKK